MEWLQENWFWLFVIIMFIGMHMGGHGHGGHGGHAGHAGHLKSRDGEPGNAEGEGVGPDDHNAHGGGNHAQH